MADAAIKRVVVVTHYLAAQVIDYLDGRYDGLLEVQFQDQPVLNGAGGALSAAGRDDTSWVHQAESIIVAASDYAYPRGYISALVGFHRSHDSEISVSLRQVPPHEKPLRSQTEMNPAGCIIRIVEKPTPIEITDAPSANLLFVLPARAIEFARAELPSERGEIELPGVINRMIASGMSARGLLQDSPRDFRG